MKSLRKNRFGRTAAVTTAVLLVTVFASGCTPESPPLKPSGEARKAAASAAPEPVFSAEDVITDFYDALLVHPDFDKVYEYTVPPKFLDQITESARSEFDDPSSDFNYYDYAKEEYEDIVPYIKESGPWFKILACEKIEDAATGEVNRLLNGNRQPDDDDYESVGTRADFDEDADPGTDVYAAVVKWGFDRDGETYEETEIIWVECIDGKWYIMGNYW